MAEMPEAPQRVADGIRKSMGQERQAFAARTEEAFTRGEKLMEKVLGWGNLKEALKRVKANGGAAGVDGEKFFDRVNHDVLMARMARRIEDKRLLKLIRRYLEAGMMVEGVVQYHEEGTPQGGPLSPLLSNVLLDDLDKELERRGHTFCRYADDCNVYVWSRAAGERVMVSLEKFLAKRLRLWVGPGAANSWAIR